MNVTVSLKFNHITISPWYWQIWYCWEILKCGVTQIDELSQLLEGGFLTVRTLIVQAPQLNTLHLYSEEAHPPWQEPALRGRELHFLPLSGFVTAWSPTHQPWAELQHLYLPFCEEDTWASLGKTQQHTAHGSQTEHLVLPFGEIEWFWELGHCQGEIHTDESNRSHLSSSKGWRREKERGR